MGARLRDSAADAAAAVIDAVAPERAVERWDASEVSGAEVVLVSIGKGALGLARGMRRGILGRGGLVVGGVVLHPAGREHEVAATRAVCDASGTGRWSFLEVDHPIPTARNVAGVGALRRLLEREGRGRTLVMGISGGGSAHLCEPREGLGLIDVAEVTGAMLRGGATIDELNTVRKHLEVLKGGGLARLAAACGVERVIGVVMSDVVHDDLSIIASGPLSPDPTTFADALAIVERYAGKGELVRVRTYLLEGAVGKWPETPKPADGDFGRVSVRVVCSNRDAIDAALQRLGQMGFVVERAPGVLLGEAAAMGATLGSWAAACAARHAGACAIVAGGETTVRVGGGIDRVRLGGRNQEVGLACALELERRGMADCSIGARSWAVCAFGTDGVDGPTPAAGALIESGSEGTLAWARASGADPMLAMATHNVYPLLESCGGLLVTGPTGTNANDVAMVLFGPLEES